MPLKNSNFFNILIPLAKVKKKNHPLHKKVACASSTATWWKLTAKKVAEFLNQTS